MLVLRALLSGSQSHSVINFPIPHEGYVLPLCLRLSRCQQDNSKRRGWISIKFFGGVGCNSWIYW